MTDSAGGGLISLVRRWRGARHVQSTAPEPSPVAAFENLFGGEGPQPARASPDPIPSAFGTGADTTPPADLSHSVSAARVDPIAFLAPTDLRRTDPEPMRLLAIGSCLLQDLLGNPDPRSIGAQVEFILWGLGGALPHHPPSNIAGYDAQVIQLPLRGVLPDEPLGALATADEKAQAAKFAASLGRLTRGLAAAMKWNIEHGIPSFVMNFMQPQFNRLGRFHPRFSLANPEYFVMRLNQELERLAAGYRNCHILDIDRLAASFGRRYVQDDLVYATNHNARLKPHARIDGRIEPVGSVSNFYEIQPNGMFRQAILAELQAMRTTLRQTGSIKLAVIDLDDTLWRGVSGDIEDISPQVVEGEPLGLIEALHVLRARGILLAIISKNDEARIRSIWKTIFGPRLSLDDFAAIRINWRQKHENMQEILTAMNLLSGNVLFIDDNPAERAQMQAAFPEMRLLDGNPFLWRRILLLAPELQVAALTNEAAQRTEMMRAQLQREAERAELSPEDFAREQNISVRLAFLASVDHSRFPRALELINKTNQFNTTGRRWKAEECAAFFKVGGVFAVFDVEDRFTPYGLVGVVILAGAEMRQWVMSCRVIGMRVEQAVMAALVAQLRAAGHSEITAVLIRTDVNQPCQSLFADAGFAHSEKIWKLPPDRAPAMPAYVRLETATPKLPPVA